MEYILVIYLQVSISETILEERYHIPIQFYEGKCFRVSSQYLCGEIPWTWSYFYHADVMERIISDYHLKNFCIFEKILSEMFFCFYAHHQRKISFTNTIFSIKTSFVNHPIDSAQLVIDLLTLAIVPESSSHFLCVTSKYSLFEDSIAFE